MLENVFGDNFVPSGRVCERHRRLFEGREQVQDDKRPGRPATERTEGEFQNNNDILRKVRAFVCSPQSGQQQRESQTNFA